MFILFPCHTVARRLPIVGGRGDGAEGVREGVAVRGNGISADVVCELAMRREIKHFCEVVSCSPVSSYSQKSSVRLDAAMNSCPMLCSFFSLELPKNYTSPSFERILSKTN